MKKIALFLTLACAVLLTSSFASAGAYSGSGNHDNSGKRHHQGQRMTDEQRQAKMDHRLEKMTIMLDLSAEQQQQLKTLFIKNQQQRQVLRNKLQTCSDDFRAYKQGNEFDETQFRAKAQKQADLKIELQVQRAKAKQQVAAILTATQRDKAAKLKALRGDKGNKGQMKKGMKCNKSGKMGKKCRANS